MSGGVQVIFVENDPAVSVGAVQELATKLGAGKDSDSVCGLDAVVQHSFLSPFDNPNENKFWLREVTRKVADYLVNGTQLPQDGIMESEKGWPRCQLTCTRVSCLYTPSLLEEAAEHVEEAAGAVGDS